MKPTKEQIVDAKKRSLACPKVIKYPEHPKPSGQIPEARKMEEQIYSDISKYLVTMFKLTTGAIIHLMNKDYPDTL
jgi:hypothetical protein